MAKVKEVSVLLDEEFHRALRERMAEKGEAWGRLIERLLRE